MKRTLALAALVLALGGCASWSWPWSRPSAALLDRAERQVTTGQYRAAVATYDQILARYPDDPVAPQVLERRDTLAAMVAARTEADRLRDEVHRLRDELARREGDLARVRQELAARQAEADRLRGDLERLKQIDLRMERKR